MSPNPTDISVRLHVRGSTKPKAEVSHDIVPSATGELLTADDIPGHIVQSSDVRVVSSSCPQQKGLLNRMYSTSHYIALYDVYILPAMHNTSWAYTCITPYALYLLL